VTITRLRYLRPAPGVAPGSVLASGLPPPITDISGLGARVATFLATPDSANLAAALSDETGTGAAVFANSPVLVTPALGTPSAIVLTNATALPTTALTGATLAAQEPAHTGDMTNMAGSLATAVGSIGGKAVTLGGAFTMSGAFGTTLNVTATTTLTLPPGGTLATVAGSLQVANNLSDLASAAAARTNLGAGSANGLATLDSGGHLTAAQIPSSIVGALDYQGTWNASTNSPALASSTGTKGFYYKVSVAGTTTLDGISSWSLGDSVVFDGSTWDKIDGNAAEVLSVAGRSGAVVLSTSDISGTTLAAQEPAHTGDMTNAAGSLATTVGSIGGKAVSLGGALTTTGAAGATLAFGAAGNTYAFPNASDTVVTAAAAQTLTNKSISGAQVNSGTVPLAQMPTVFGAPPYITGASMWYLNPYVTAMATSGVGVANSYYAVPFWLSQSVTIKGVAIRVVATSTGNSSAALQAAIYSDLVTTGNVHRPGALIDYTTSFATGAAGLATATLNNTTDTLVGPGMVWIVLQKFDATATYAALSATGSLIAAAIGTPTLGDLLGASGTVLSGVSTTGAAFGGTNWANFTSATSWTEIVGTAAAPLAAIEVA
jgi:hypothetical protein